MAGTARARGVIPAQVMWPGTFSRDVPPCPEPVNPARIAENLAAVEVRLTPGDLTAIDALDTGVRGGPAPESVTLERYGVPIPDA